MSPPASERYELLEVLGRGGVGEVWKARDRSLGRVVALKLLQRSSGEDLARFRREAAVTARLNHPSIAQIYEFGESFIAMQYVDGHAAGEGQGIREKVQAVVDAARAVHYAHQNGVLHRDLKPENILVDGSGRAFVLDFGLARSTAADLTGMSLTGDILGTPAYMAPEQARGEVNRLDARTDVYGLGATLYSLLSGRPPHAGPTLLDVIRGVVEEDPPAPEGPPELRTIALKALEKDPARRYPSAAAFADDLDRWLRGEPVEARPASTMYRLRKRIARRPAVWALGLLFAVALAAAGAVGTYSLWRSRETLAQRLAQANAREAEAEARRLVDDARARLADVRVALYIDGCSLAPYFGVLEEVREKCSRALERIGDFAPAHLWIGESYLIAGEFDRAVAEMERAVEADPAAEYLWAELGRAHLIRGLDANMAVDRTIESRMSALEEAGVAAQECFQRAGPSANEAERLVAFAYSNWRDTESARFSQDLADARKALPVVPGVEDLELVLGVALPDAEAVAHMEAAIRLRPGHFIAHALLGALRDRLGDREGALLDLDRAIQIHPRYPRAYNNRGIVRVQLGDPAGARQDYDRAIDLDPSFAPAFVNRASLRRAQGDREGALDDLRHAEELSPNFEAPLMVRGEIFEREGDLEGAEEEFTRAISRAPDYAPAYIARGIIRRRMRRLDDAEADFNRAIDLSPRYSTAYNNRGSVRSMAGDVAGAMADYNRAIDLSPDNAEAYNNRGLVWLSSGDTPRAVADFERAMDLDPAFAAPCVHRGNVRMTFSDFHGAVRDYTSAIERDARYPLAYYNRAVAHRRLGEYEAAMADYDAAIGIDPAYAAAYVNRGALKADLGDSEEAIEDFSRAIDLDPAIPEAHSLRGYALAERGDFGPARTDLEQALRVAPPDWPHRSEVEEALRDVRARLGETDDP